MKSLRLGVDTNVLLDLAAGVDTVVDAFAVLDQRLASSDILVLPSVLDELAFLCDAAETEPIRQSAFQAIKLVREQSRFRALLELSCPQAVVEEVAREVRFRRLLPEEEVHDSLILAEATMLGCGLLLTSDKHLRGGDHELLTLVLNPFDLIPPVIASPREIVRRFFH